MYLCVCLCVCVSPLGTLLWGGVNWPITGCKVTGSARQARVSNAEREGDRMTGGEREGENRMRESE